MIAVHIGFPKTGTTTQQKHLFAKHSQVSYLGKPYENEVLKKEILKLVMEESLTYDPTILKEYLVQQAAKENNQGKKLMVLSDELLVSASKVRDKGVVANRIKEVFAPAKILVTIRNQLEMLKSAYVNSGRLLKHVPPKYKKLAITFEDWLEMTWENPDRSYIGNISYANTIDYYVKLFGKENVCVLLFEEFVSNKEEYTRKLSEFLNIDADESGRLLEGQHENPGLLQSQLDLELSLSKWGIPGRLPLIPGILGRWYRLKGLFNRDEKARVHLPKSWQERLKKFYSEGNRKLINHYHLPMEKYGYLL
ncbi:MAG: sulfotransferase [Candidatus Aminicenantes bacterium]|nr:MAG: sulfotransferase [Candidatus Aminicenantes bacterium]